MPISRNSRGFLISSDAWGAPALGLETEKLQSCIEELRVQGYENVFGRYPEFKESDLKCLEAIPDLRSAAFWDINLSDISSIYHLPYLTYFRISGKRPPIDFARLPSIQNLVVEHHKRDLGYTELSKLKMLHLWRFKAPTRDVFEFHLPETVERLGIFWSNVEHLDGFGRCPNVRKLNIARCRNLNSLGNLRENFPRLEHLVVQACGRLTAEEVRRALKGHPNIQHALAGKKLIVGDLIR